MNSEGIKMNRIRTWIEAKGLGVSAEHKGIRYWTFWIAVYIIGMIIILAITVLVGGLLKGYIP